MSRSRGVRVACGPSSKVIATTGRAVRTRVIVAVSACVISCGRVMAGCAGRPCADAGRNTQGDARTTAPAANSTCRREGFSPISSQSPASLTYPQPAATGMMSQGLGENPVQASAPAGLSCDIVATANSVSRPTMAARKRPGAVAQRSGGRTRCRPPCHRLNARRRILRCPAPPISRPQPPPRPPRPNRQPRADG